MALCFAQSERFFRIGGRAPAQGRRPAWLGGPSWAHCVCDLFCDGASASASWAASAQGGESDQAGAGHQAGGGHGDHHDLVLVIVAANRHQRRSGIDVAVEGSDGVEE